MRGSDEQFDQIAMELRKNIKSYEERAIKYIQYCDKIDFIFSNYGWSKAEFYDELNKRLGIETNDSRRAERQKRLATKPVAKKRAKKKKE